MSVFTSLANIDTGHTKAAGFDWYTDFAWPNLGGVSSPQRDPWLTFAPQSSGNLSIVSGALHSTAGATTSNINIASATYTSGSGYAGSVFGPGGAFRATLKWGTVDAFGTGFFIFPIEFFTGSATSFIEFDIAEGQSNGTNTQSHTIIWDTSSNPAGETVNTSRVYAYDGSAYATVELIWTTIAQSGTSTGSYAFYVNNVLQGAPFTYVITDPIAVMDSQHFVLLFSSQGTQDILSCGVWQKP
jgi:hypothetical protein